MIDKPTLKLVGQDGNAFFILGRAHQAARRAGWPDAKWKAVSEKARSGDYDNLLRVMMEEFNCDPDGGDDNEQQED